MIKGSFFNNILFPQDYKKDHFKALDGLRGMAVLLVVLGHTSLDKMFIAPGLNFEYTGKMGVFLFFVLSAYLLDRQIIIGYVNKKANYKFWLNYSMRRFLRIYPLFFIALLVFFAASKFSPSSPITTPRDIINNLFLIKGDGIFWSIVVEFKYYFISPFIMAFCNYVLKWDFKKVSVFLGLITAACIYYVNTSNLSEISFVRYLPIFLTGTFLSIYEVVYLKERESDVKKNKALEIAGLAAALIILLTIPHLFNTVFGQHIKGWYFHDPIFYFPYALLWAIVLLSSKYGKFEFLKKIFEFKILRFLGVVSFSTYLFHIPVMKVIELSKLHINKNVQFYVFFLVTSGLVFLSYLLIERPLQQIKIDYESTEKGISFKKKKKTKVFEEAKPAGVL